MLINNVRTRELPLVGNGSHLIALAKVEEVSIGGKKKKLVISERPKMTRNDQKNPIFTG